MTQNFYYKRVVYSAIDCVNNKLSDICENLAGYWWLHIILRCQEQ